MNTEQHRKRSTPRPNPGFGRRLLGAILEGADDALRESCREAKDRADDEQQCWLRPGYSRLTRGYAKIS